jgi:DNA-binding protein HU-beta
MPMTRTDVIESIAARTSLTKAQADTALYALQEILMEAVGKEEAVRLTGFLTVESVMRSARKGRNPRTGEEIDIPAARTVKVTAGKALKDAAR